MNDTMNFLYFWSLLLLFNLHIICKNFKCCLLPSNTENLKSKCTNKGSHWTRLSDCTRTEAQQKGGCSTVWLSERQSWAIKLHHWSASRVMAFSHWSSLFQNKLETLAGAWGHEEPATLTTSHIYQGFLVFKQAPGDKASAYYYFKLSLLVNSKYNWNHSFVKSQKSGSTLLSVAILPDSITGF